MTTDTTPQFAPASKPVEPVCFVDEDGNLLDGAEPALDAQGVRDGIRLMMLARAFDTKCFSLQRQGKLGTFAPVVGQEANASGSAMAGSMGAALRAELSTWMNICSVVAHRSPLSASCMRT